MTTPITTTLKALREYSACVEGYNKLVCHLSEEEYDEEKTSHIRFHYDKEINLLTILESNGIDDALWALRASNASDRDMRLYAVWCARQVEHLMEDQRSKDALDVAERFSNGNATEKELSTARAAAWDDARDAASATARAAARAAASDAAWDAAMAAASDAAWDAARAAASDAAWDAARAAASDAAWGAQKEMFIKMCNGNAPWQQLEVK